MNLKRPKWISNFEKIVLKIFGNSLLAKEITSFSNFNQYWIQISCTKNFHIFISCWTWFYFIRFWYSVLCFIFRRNWQSTSWVLYTYFFELVGFDQALLQQWQRLVGLRPRINYRGCSLSVRITMRA